MRYSSLRSTLLMAFFLAQGIPTSVPAASPADGAVPEVSVEIDWRQFLARQVAARLVELHLHKGESVLLYGGDAPPATSIQPLSRDASQLSPYGLKRAR